MANSFLSCFGLGPVNSVSHNEIQHSGGEDRVGLESSIDDGVQAGVDLEYSPNDLGLDWSLSKII